MFVRVIARQSSDIFSGDLDTVYMRYNLHESCVVC